MESGLSYLLSQIFGGAALIARPGARAIQSRFPDTTSIRLTEIAPRAFTSASYALLQAGVPSLIQGTAAVRAGILSTKWGQAHKRLVSATTFSTSMIPAFLLFKEPIDLLPIFGAAGGTAVDFQDQARYQRLPYLLYPLIWGTVAASKENWAALVSDIVATGILWKTVYKEDIKGACGLSGASFGMDFHSYWYGIAHNAPTGASVKGQVSTAPGHGDLTEQYKEKLSTKINPFFVTQNEVANALNGSSPSPQTPCA